jgi:hypothetical protein
MTLTLAPDTEARLLAAAAEKGLAPEEVIDVLLRHDATELVQDALRFQDTPEQARLRAALFSVIAKAQALTPKPQSANREQADEERMFGEIITEKYRKQGFNLP